jgi:hypothetical protein
MEIDPVRYILELDCVLDDGTEEGRALHKVSNRSNRSKDRNLQLTTRMNGIYRQDRRVVEFDDTCNSKGPVRGVRWIARQACDGITPSIIYNCQRQGSINSILWCKIRNSTAIPYPSDLFINFAYQPGKRQSISVK